MIIMLNFEERKAKQWKLEGETLKLWPVSETSRDTTGVRQRATDSLQKF